MLSCYARDHHKSYQVGFWSGFGAVKPVILPGLRYFAGYSHSLRLNIFCIINVFLILCGIPILLPIQPLVIKLLSR